MFQSLNAQNGAHCHKCVSSEINYVSITLNAQNGAHCHSVFTVK